MLHFNLLFQALWQTVYMVFTSGFFAILIGFVLGAGLWATGPKGFSHRRFLHPFLGVWVNIGRSVPYIILLVVLIPFTRWLVGTSIGTNAAIVSLTVAAIPFYARIVQNAFDHIPSGLMEAGLSMGGKPLQILWRILLPESLPALIRGATLTLIGLIGYSAMAGAVGGGGLGQLAIDYGYERFDVWVMLQTVVLLVILVQVVQGLGDLCARHAKRSLRYLLGFLIFFWAIFAIFTFWPRSESMEVIKVGVSSGPMAEIVMKAAQQVALKQDHIQLKVIVFDDYTLPNAALNDGEIDANIFQHVPFLEAEKKAHGYDLVSVAKTFVYPMGIYSQTITQLSQLKRGDVVALQNDPTNEGRSLLILQAAGLIHLKTGNSPLATVQDIDKNPRGLVFKTLDAAQLPRVLKDVALAAINNDFAKASGLKLSQAILKEGADSPYANIIVVQASRAHEAFVQQLIQIMHSQAVIDATMKIFPGGEAVVAWSSKKT